MPRIPQIEVPSRSMDMVSVPSPSMAGAQAIARGREAIGQGISQLANAYADYEIKRNKLDTQQYLNETNLQLDIWEKERSKNNTINYAGKNPDGLVDEAVKEFDSIYDKAIYNARTESARDILSRERDFAKNKVQYKFQSQQERLSNAFGLKTFIDNREKRLESIYSNPDAKDAMKAMMDTDLEIMQAKGLLLDDDKRARFQTAHKEFAKSYLDGALSLGKGHLSLAKDFLTNDKHPQKLLADKMDTDEKLSYLKKIESLQEVEKNESARKYIQSLDLIVKDIHAGGAVFNNPTQRNKTIEMIRQGVASGDERIVQKADEANAYMRLAEIEDHYLLTGEVADIPSIQGLPPIQTPIGEIILQNKTNNIKADVQKKLITKGADYLYANDAQTRGLVNSVIAGSPDSFASLKTRADLIYDKHDIPQSSRSYLTPQIKAMYENPINQAKVANNPGVLIDVVDRYKSAFGDSAHGLSKELKIHDDVKPLFFVSDDRKMELAQFITSDFKPDNSGDYNNAKDMFPDTDFYAPLSEMGGTTNRAGTMTNVQKMTEFAAKYSLMHSPSRIINMNKSEEMLSSRFAPLTTDKANVFVDKQDPYAPDANTLIKNFYKNESLIDHLNIAIPKNGYTKEQYESYIKDRTKLVSDFDYSTYLLVHKDTLNPVVDVNNKPVYLDLGKIKEINTMDESKRNFNNSILRGGKGVL